MTTRHAVAYHEAGHAVYGLHVGMPVEFASIRPDPRQRLLGMVKYMAAPYRLADAKRLVQATLAGPVAEAIATGQPLNLRPGGGSDDAEIVRILGCGGHTPHQARQLAMRWVPEVYAVLLQPATWQRVVLVASNLMAVGRLDGGTLHAILDSR